MGTFIYDARSEEQKQGRNPLVEFFQNYIAQQQARKEQEKAVQRQRMDAFFRGLPRDQQDDYLAANPDYAALYGNRPQFQETPEEKAARARAEAQVSSLQALQGDQGAYGQVARYNLGTGSNAPKELIEMLYMKGHLTDDQFKQAMGVQGGIVESADNIGDNRSAAERQREKLEAEAPVRESVVFRNRRAGEASSASAGLSTARTKTEGMRQDGTLPSNTSPGKSEADKAAEKRKKDIEKLDREIAKLDIELKLAESEGDEGKIARAQMFLNGKQRERARIVNGTQRNNHPPRPSSASPTPAPAQQSGPIRVTSAQDAANAPIGAILETPSGRVKKVAQGLYEPVN